MNQPQQPTQRQAHPQAAAPAKQKAVAQNADSEADDEDLENQDIGNKFLIFNVMPSWLVSFLTHIAVIIILAIIIMPSIKEKKVALEAGEQTAAPTDEIDLNLDAMEFEESELLETEIQEESSSTLSEEMEVSLPEAQVEFGNIMGVEATNLDIGEIGELDMSENSNETRARSGTGKEQLLKKYGGNKASEDAVQLALKWIIDHQLSDGGWNLDHTIGPGKHRNSPDPGTKNQARAGATALAILPLLGAGHTHKTGQYKRQVQAGLTFLMKRGKKSGRGISYHEPGGSMYSHGLVSIVFCEAFAMTKDSQLMPYAQGTVWFIEDAQDPVGGGWRYRPRQAGDTSAVGWQLMALKSGKISGLDINPRTYKRAEKFLDNVSIHSGAYYGYTTPPSKPVADARTAVGLLCRMYMGWKKDAPGLRDGVELMMKKGPNTSKGPNMYYNYYATQVIKHMGGSDWNKWNPTMRDFLVKTQQKKGVMAGSWTPGNSHAADAGGRLYMTSLSCMTLEVYYRYLPLYGDKASSDEFPLD